MNEDWIFYARTNIVDALDELGCVWVRIQDEDTIGFLKRAIENLRAVNKQLLKIYKESQSLDSNAKKVNNE